MRYVIITTISFALLVSCYSKASKFQQPEGLTLIENSTLNQEFSLSLTSDSGYICANDALRFLVGKALIDTTGGTDWKAHIRYTYSLKELFGNDTAKFYTYWYAEPADTIGKYYALGGNGNYVAALSLGNEVLVLELTSQSAIVSYDLQGHGNHACCWSSIDDMLKKYGDYLGITTCGTGMSYCSSHLRLFKDKINSQSENSIPVFVYIGALGEDIPGYILTSTMQFKDSSLMMHYKQIEYTEDESGKQKTVSTKHFTMKYVYGTNGFETDEGYKLDGVLL